MTSTAALREPDAAGTNLTEALAAFTDTWAPRNVAKLNDYDVRVVHIKGEFIWHSHADTDELFYIVAGAMMMELRDQSIPLGPGDLYVVPAGVEHRPTSTDGADIMLLEPSGTTNTGTAAEEIPDHITTTAGVEL